MRLKGFLKKSTWRLKAINRTKKNKSLNKRIKELVKSRNSAKEKNSKLMAERDELKKENARLRKELKKN
jgi:septal ring factor EnvC (AmiA/AmiB activator)